MTIITFAHHKGGTGKTTSCLNISGFLQKAGKRVLVIDIDPQANATSGLGIDPSSLDRSIYDVFMSSVEDYPRVSIRDVTLHTEPGIDIAPSTLDLVGVEPFLYMIEHRFRILKDELSAVKGRYDFILIDTPPSMGQLVINGLIAADHTIVTFDRGVFALNGLNTLMTIFDDIEEMVGEKISPDMAILTRWSHVNGKNPWFMKILSILGIGDPGVEERENLATIENEVKTHFPSVFTVPFDQAVYQAQKSGLPISHFAPLCEAAKVYEQITSEILEWR
ncbi:MAG: chromosome partitioning protein [Methanolinea sp. SDB]|nr:MAG: chromosome partitioning protein [Methanolinea sp. SDB]